MKTFEWPYLFFHSHLQLLPHLASMSMILLKLEAFKGYLFLFYVCLCIACTLCGAFRGQKRKPDSPGTEVMDGCHVSPGNRSWVL